MKIIDSQHKNFKRFKSLLKYTDNKIIIMNMGCLTLKDLFNLRNGVINK
jgi:hypothetical protein